MGSGMKKNLLLATLICISGLAQATTINCPSGLTGNVLNGKTACSWGINIVVPTGQTITSAEIDFTGVSCTTFNFGANNLFCDLLNNNNTGVSTVNCGSHSGDYWLTQYTGANSGNLCGISTQSCSPFSQNWNCVLTSAQLDCLNSYLVKCGGTFNFGLSANCGLNLGGCQFKYSCGGNPPPKSVPDFASTAFLVMLGLVGVEIFRRQLVPVKA
jgi:hypothetical protein